MDELLVDFLTETAENIGVVDNEIVRWERNPTDRAMLDNIFRLVHTIKGTCGFLNLPRLEALAHAGETVLGRVRDGKLTVSAHVVSEVLASLDGIKAILRVLESTGKEPEGDDAGLIARLERVAAGEAAPGVPAVAAAPEAEAARAPQSIRVSVDLLEQLMTTVSELVLTRNQLLQIARRAGEGDAYAVALQRLSQCVSEIQDGVMRTRMQPVSNAWAALPRMVRNLSLELGKKIELEMHGGETELDRQLLELIKDPLAHMVRNACDHGLEDPRSRAAAGKREVGRLRLNAHQEGGHIVIELSDDGRGLNLDRLKAKAIDAGLLRERDAAELTNAQAAKLMFHAGLSTAEQVTAVSGRGVGMDVVKSNIEKIGGTVEVDSTPGRGTRFTMRVPLTLAIIPALIVAAGGERFAVPQIAVRELVGAGSEGENRIETLHDAQVLRLRDRLLPVVSLARLLGLPESDSEESYVVVAQAGSFSFGLVVDDVHDTEEIVVKPVAPLLSGVPVYSGNAILGDGRVIMILDVNGIAALGTDAGDRDARVEAEEEVVEDTAAERDAMLVFRAGSPHPKAVPLSLVSRLEEIAVETIEWSEDRPVVQYRGEVMPIVTVDEGASLKPSGRQPMLVFNDGARAIALAVDAVIDIVEDVVDISLSGEVGGRLGSAVIGGRVTEVLDIGHYLNAGLRPVVRTTASAGRATVLIVDDSAFFRNMLRPLLSAAGYDVTTAASAEEALRLREAGRRYDLILSDIEMPGQSGVDLAKAVKSGGEWAATPMIALSSLVSDDAQARGRDAGFDDYVPKFDRVSLLSLLERQLSKVAA
ncbi:chemotaxis protein CheW [Sphingoaurantiacus capsulatus]|uniref:histidine kinase n=1 Tax=Sphingoaurantiacus capsulatus TaxID=1771310 RepID=A0ABV7XDN0_9SPHN